MVEFNVQDNVRVPLVTNLSKANHLKLKAEVKNIGFFFNNFYDVMSLTVSCSFTVGLKPSHASRYN